MTVTDNFELASFKEQNVNMPSSCIIVVVVVVVFIIIIQLFMIYVQIKPLRGQPQKRHNIDNINYITDTQKPKYNSHRAGLGSSIVERLQFPPYAVKKTKNRKYNTNKQKCSYEETNKMINNNSNSIDSLLFYLQIIINSIYFIY
jgi:hypothetical protein